MAWRCIEPNSGICSIPKASAAVVSCQDLQLRVAKVGTTCATWKDPALEKKSVQAKEGSTFAGIQSHVIDLLRKI